MLSVTFTDVVTTTKSRLQEINYSIRTQIGSEMRALGSNIFDMKRKEIRQNWKRKRDSKLSTV